MTNVQAFLSFLKSGNTGLKKKSADWVRARQDTIGASGIAALIACFRRKFNPTCLIMWLVHGAIFSNHSCVDTLSKNILFPFLAIVFLLILQAGTRFFER